MHRIREIACLIALAALTPVWLSLSKALPEDHRALVEKKYEGWTGVLRLWVVEGWAPEANGFSGWLNRCAARFEKAHPGAYIQPQYVDAGALSALGNGDALPPDLLLFPPGALDAPTGLLPLKARAAIRPPLRAAGRWNGSIYALPVALGGYGWAFDASLPSIPNSWRDSDARLAVPVPEEEHAWGAALLSLCALRYAPDEAGPVAMATPPVEIDLALGGVAPVTPSPAPTPAPSPEALLPCRLPESFDFRADAFRAFVNGDADACLVTQREIARLRALGDQGKGPDWQLATSGLPFTDQVLYAAVVDRPGHPDRDALCEAWLDHLLTDECQSALSGGVAFPATAAPTGAADTALNCLDSALRRDDLTAARAFGKPSSEAVDALVRPFIEGDRDADAIWPELAALLG